MRPARLAAEQSAIPITVDRVPPSGRVKMEMMPSVVPVIENGILNQFSAAKWGKRAIKVVMMAAIPQKNVRILSNPFQLITGASAGVRIGVSAP